MAVGLGALLRAEGPLAERLPGGPVALGPPAAGVVVGHGRLDAVACAHLGGGVHASVAVVVAAVVLAVGVWAGGQLGNVARRARGGRGVRVLDLGRRVGRRVAPDHPELDGASLRLGAEDAFAHAGGHAEVDVDGGEGGGAAPLEPGFDALRTLGGVVVVEDAGLRVEEVRCERRLASAEAVRHGAAGIGEVLRPVTRERGLDQHADGLHFDNVERVGVVVEDAGGRLGGVAAHARRRSQTLGHDAQQLGGGVVRAEVRHLAAGEDNHGVTPRGGRVGWARRAGVR